MGTQIIVGFRAKMKMEKASNFPVFLLEVKISFKMIKEKTITGKSGLGDCENRNKMGRKNR